MFWKKRPKTTTDLLLASSDQLNSKMNSLEPGSPEWQTCLKQLADIEEVKQAAEDKQP